MNLLIVDDEQPVRELVSRWLAPDGHTMLQAADADSAVAILEQQPVAVLLCDRAMPGRDGDWLVAQVRERFPSVAVILATADDAVPPRISLQDGVIGYLVKPFKVEQVRAAVSDAIAWHQVASKSPRRQLDADAMDSWLRRAGRPGPKGEDA